MAKNLVIVESPAKGKTIEKYLGKDFIVRSSFGHIRDLPKKGLNIDLDNNFKPHYEVPADKAKTVSDLRKAAERASAVWLASDEDREGEAIAWHLCKALHLDETKTKRIVFHEITKQAIERAVTNPRTVNITLVNAQQARRVLDRLVGYELSPVLWKKVRPGLSAGRVQSVAVRLIVEREREIKVFKPDVSYKVTAVFLSGEETFPAELDHRLTNEKQARDLLSSATGSSFIVRSVEQKPGTRNPGAPFTTSTLQQEAARRLGYSVKQTMTLAQRLYENGHITYMRTDSTVLSGYAIKSAEQYIKTKYGAKYHKLRQFKTKSQGAQEAHEAIRPTDFSRLSAGSDSQQEKLYKLIWIRALASQMAAAEVDKTEIQIEQRPDNGRQSTPAVVTYISKGEILKFDGFFKVYGGTKDDVLLPPLKQGQNVEIKSMEAKQSFTKPAARYSEASLVRKLEELGIGRPSTYAPTISTIQSRGYIEKRDLEGVERTVRIISLEASQIQETEIAEITGADRNKLVPTALAEITTDFLTKHFSSIVDYGFTARVEESFDHVAEGKQEWESMISDFYRDFHPLIEGSESVTREETSQSRELGIDPKSGKPIFARFGRFGPMLQRGITDSEEKPDFAPLPQGVDMNDVTLEQALEMFKLPRTVGKTEDGQEIKSNIGRFGPYIQVGKLYVSIKPLDPMKITQDEAREFYSKKLKQEAEKHIQTFPSGIQVLNGPYGPYVTDGTKNVRIAKALDPTKLTEADTKALLEKAPNKKRSFRSKKTKK